MTKQEQQRAARLMAFLRRDDNKRAIEECIAGGKLFERVMAEVFECVWKNTEILECEKSSFVPAIQRAVEWDLQLGDRCYLVPRFPTLFKEGLPRLTAMQSWHGKIALMLRYKIARRVDVHCVYANDVFIPEQGFKPNVVHRIPEWVSGDRGPMIGAYAFAQLTQTDYKLVVLREDKINENRLTWSEQYRFGTLDDVGEFYAKKTCVHLLSKELPIEPEWKRAFSDDDDLSEAISAAA